MPAGEPFGGYFDDPQIPPKGGGGGSPPITSTPSLNPYQTGILPTGPFSSGPTAFGGARRRLMHLGGGLRARQFMASTPEAGGDALGLRGGAGATEGFHLGGPTPTPTPTPTSGPPAPGPPGMPGPGEVVDPTRDWAGSGPRLLQNLIGYLGAYGGLDPRGSGSLLDALNADIQQRNRGRIESAIQGAQAYAPDDPYLRNYARIGAEQAGYNELGRELSGARAQSALQNQALLQQILAAFLGGPVSRKDPKQVGHLGVNVGPVGVST